VYAVDPGALTVDMRAPHNAGRIVHLQMRGAEALAMLAAQSGADRPAAAGGAVRLGIFVCDMNTPPAETVTLLLEHVAPLLADGALVVLTFKRCMGGDAAAWARSVAQETARVAAACDGVRNVHLLANTKKEETVLARFSAAKWRQRQGA
jgi:hypothetical protein